MEQDNVYDNQDLRVGDIVRFHTPYIDEDPNTIFIVLWSYYDPEGKSSRAEVVKFDRALKHHPLIQKWFIRDLERVAQVSPELMQEIKEFMKNKLGNAIVSRLLI
ncbi:hypothetical protein LZQ00_06335 [Sphingobacterium sp. SRCM116780]|uniref:hypothetical protein n=1 Tax=Sphingobacterium sp. SRCM116780 TaxID=2907623 RepID=UPI001F3C151E|nr:hypothetical protein [Sphingobacterium sp. SRCM116780]UIR57432.1 hypothetical protein LZQ00_06335 [Sphingobacterium sp. SRCM116780]